MAIQIATQAATRSVGFFGMLHGIYGAVAALASAAQRGANALDNLGQWAEEQTGTFVDEARIERAIKLDELTRRREELSAQGIIIEAQATEVNGKTKAIKAPAKASA